MITSSGKFTEGPFMGLPLQAASTDYLTFVTRTRPLPHGETLAIETELYRRKNLYSGVCPICGHYSHSARNNRFALGANRKGRR